MKLSGKKGTEQSKKKSVGKAKKASEVIKVPGDWLYMTPQEISVRQIYDCLLYTSPSPRDVEESRMPSSA